MGRDRGGIVLGWLLRLSVALALFGVVAADGLSLGVTRLTTADDAARAASGAAAEYARTGRVDAAYAAALYNARRTDPDAAVPRDGFRVGPDGVVRLLLVRRARTVLMHRVPPIASWAVISRTGEAPPAPR